MRAARWFLLLLVLVGLAAIDVHLQLRSPLPLAETVRVEVPRGSSLDQALRDWQARGLLRDSHQRWVLSAYARATGDASHVQAGEYQLAPGLDARGLIALLVSGRVVLHELRAVEGWRFEQLLAVLREHPAIRQTLPQADGPALMAALGEAGTHPEGRFYPDTYRFPRGTTDLEFLRRAFGQMERVLAEEWGARDAGLPYKSAEQALIMASIVERETGVAEERPAIAGVFVRRLQTGMLLQTDPSVIYGLGAKFDGNLRKVDLLTDGPYNTYTRRGLPPTPICLPGRAAIHAALHPAPGEALYFVSRGDGSHQFSVTFEEHDAAVRKYQLRRRQR